MNRMLVSISFLFTLTTSGVIGVEARSNETISSRVTQPLTDDQVINPEKIQLLRLVDQRELNIDFFNKVLNQPNIELTLLALQGAGRIGGDKATELVSNSFKDARYEVRQMTAFALGISASANAAPILWQQLILEKNPSVKKEIYLALGSIGQKDIIPQLLGRYQKEELPEVVASIFQALTFALTFHPKIANNIDMKKNQSVIDFTAILSLLERDDIVAYQAGYFLARIKLIEKKINPAQLKKFTALLKKTNSKKVLAKLIGKVTKRNHLANRRLLSWLIEQSESNDIGLATESIRAMSSLLYIPQAKIQLGKLHTSKNTLIAQTAMNALAQSDLEGREIQSLLKKQLKSEKPAIVVEAIRGLLKRQKREDMSWALKILSHNSTYIKIRFAQMIFDKDAVGFENVISMLAKDDDKKVSEYAQKLLSPTKVTPQNSSATLTPINSLKGMNKHVVELTTTAGKIRIDLNGEAIYTGLNFLRLIQSDYYNDTFFSRVIGNFVAQGGDSIGDGNGSSQLTIREELNYLSHLTGTVGMATSGKDTGDSQFFINLADNTHLDRHYTVFGSVIDGMDNVFKLSNGDKILSARVVK